MATIENTRFVNDSGVVELEGTVQTTDASFAVTGGLTFDGTAGLDLAGGGITNAGVVHTGGADIDSEGGDITTSGGLLTSGGGEIDSATGDVNTGGGDLLVGAGALRFGSTFRVNANATIAGTNGTAFLGNCADVANGGTKPNLPAVVTAQDIATALVALGLVTQT